MTTRGTATNYLIDYAENNIEEEWKEAYFDSKCEVL
jgi:hypothetical protein